MNTANKLTILRVILIPVFVVFLLYDFVPFHSLVAAGIFVLASATDWLDGHIARKYNQITNFGKIVDPLADKLLVAAALIGLVELGTVSSWVAIIILSREFIITGIRIAAASEGVVIAASWWGKIKTTLQFVAIVAALVFGPGLWIDIAMWTAAVATLVSGVDYVVKNIRFLSMK